MGTKLVRSQTDKMIAGVCGGIAAYLNVDSVLVRFAFIMLLFASGIALPLYIILMIIMPVEDDDGIRINPADSAVEEEIKFTNSDFSTVKNDSQTGSRPNTQGPIIFAAVLILTGLYLLAQNAGFLSFLDFGWFGPLLIIGIGLYIIYRRR